MNSADVITPGARARTTVAVPPWARGKCVTVIEIATREGVEQAYCRCAFATPNAAGQMEGMATWIPVTDLKPDYTWETM